MLWDTEDLGRAPAAEMNDQAAFYLNFLYGMVTAEVKNPVEEGEFKSGSSGTLGMIATQLSERSRSAMVTALKDMHRDKTKLIMRAIVRVNRDFPSRVDKISVYDPRVTGKGFIEAGPDDVIGWEAGIQVRAEPAIPTERNLLLAQARQEKELGFDSEVYMGATLGHEDIPSIKVRRFREDMESVVQQQVLMPMLVSRVIASQQSLSDEEQQQSLDLATGSSQQLEQALASGRSAGQSASNTSRGAVPERPQGQGRI